MKKKYRLLFLLACFISLFLLKITELPEKTRDYAQFGQSPVGLTNVGYATFNLTANTFNCDGFLAATQNLSVLNISFLYNTFGNNFDCLKTILADDRTQLVQVHLINEPGHRNNRLGNYEFLKAFASPSAYDKKLRQNDQKLKKRFVKYVKRLRTVLQNHLRPRTSLIINPGLESNVSDAAAKNLIAWTRGVFPTARVVWNPLMPSPNRRKKAKADFLEGHNLTPNLDAPCIFNLDGTDVSFPWRPAFDEVKYEEGNLKNWVQSGPPLWQVMENYANTCEVAFVWTAESNGLDYRKKGFIDPRKRDHNVSTATYRQIMQEVQYLHTKGKLFNPGVPYSDDDNRAFRGCNVIKEFSDGKRNGNLLKQSEFRDRGGVLLLPKNYSTIKNIRLHQGVRLVDTYVNVGFYKDGRAMFRSSISPTQYPFRTVLSFNYDGQKICYKLPNPRVRID